MTPGAGEAHLAAVRAALAGGAATDPGPAVVAGGSPQALGLAVALARSGLPVALIEDDAHDVMRARDALTRAGAHQGIAIGCDPAAASGAGLVVEASGTGPAAGRAHRLSALARHAAPGALLATLGATDPATLAAALPDTAACVALDSAAPPPGLDLLEIVALPGTHPETLRRAQGLAARLGALALVTPRFLGAALLARVEDTAEALVFDGSTPWEVDAALEDFGFALGPCAAQDQRGLDLAYARHRAEDAAGTRRAPLPVLDRMVPEGRLGRKGGVGWYRYPGGGGRVIDPLVEDLAREEAHFARHATRPVAAAEIVARTLAALGDEARSLAAQTGDAGAVDLVSVLAAGFPAARGGILFHLSQPPDPA